MTAPKSNIDIAFDLLIAAARNSRSSALSGKVLGLIGYGTVGREIARRAVRRGMEVLYTDPEPGAGPHKRVLLGDLLARSDFVMPIASALHRPLADANILASMKPGACLVTGYSSHVAKQARQRQADFRNQDQQE